MVSGVSGSGKSRWFDTIYAEGQRRYVESLSAYARQFLERIEKPDVELIDGLSPAIAIKQKNSTRNPRSTVATATEIYDYLRLLYARCGMVHCIVCDGIQKRDSVDEIAEAVLGLGKKPVCTRFFLWLRNPAGAGSKTAVDTAPKKFARAKGRLQRGEAKGADEPLLTRRVEGPACRSAQARVQSALSEWDDLRVLYAGAAAGG